MIARELSRRIFPHLYIFFQLFLKLFSRSLYRLQIKLICKKIFLFPDGAPWLYMAVINKFLFMLQVRMYTIPQNKVCADSAVKKKDIFIPGGEILQSLKRKVKLQRWKL